MVGVFGELPQRLREAAHVGCERVAYPTAERLGDRTDLSPTFTGDQWHPLRQFGEDGRGRIGLRAQCL